MAGSGAALARAEELEEDGGERTVHVGPSFLVGEGLCRIWDMCGKGLAVGTRGEELVYGSAAMEGGGGLGW